jgi:hypothetical protein
MSPTCDGFCRMICNNHKVWYNGLSFGKKGQGMGNGGMSSRMRRTRFHLGLAGLQQYLGHHQLIALKVVPC